MKRILVTGSNGMLGKALLGALKGEFELFGLGASGKNRPHYLKCDISRKSRLIKEISKIKPDIIVHAAAISDVEYCQNYPEKANNINSCGTENVALAALKNRAFLIYISTDYVFDGKSRKPYKEEDISHPINIYGKTKLKGEMVIKKILDDYLIIRTSWLFGPGRDNFVTEMLKRAKKEKTMSIVADKFGSPTYTPDLACAIRDLIDLFIYPVRKKAPLASLKLRRSGPLGGVKKYRARVGSNAPPELSNGVYHLPSTIYRIIHISNSGSCSRYKFTNKILRYAGIKEVKVIPVQSNCFNWKAKRPVYSVLNNLRFKRIAGYRLKPWQEALEEYISKAKEVT